jgi:hypothetical protein
LLHPEGGHRRQHHEQQLVLVIARQARALAPPLSHAPVIVAAQSPALGALGLRDVERSPLLIGRDV